MKTRPPGHYTSLIGELRNWQSNREKKSLDVRPLILAIEYLEEARDMSLWIQELRKAGKLTGLSIEVPEMTSGFLQPVEKRFL